MSIAFPHDRANDVTKMASRTKIALDMRKSKESKIIHYLGGQNPSTPFENHFSIKRNTFVRYERENCPIPNNYTQAEWKGDNLIERKEGHFGYFVNSNFYEEGCEFMKVFRNENQYFWLDFCGMPKEEDVEQLYYTFFYDQDEYGSNIKSIYCTFFTNSRGQKYSSNLFTRYGSSLDDRAKSLCESLTEELELDKTRYKCEVFDRYFNGKASPMAVLKFSVK
jgi:hypothetical protein